MLGENGAEHTKPGTAQQPAGGAQGRRKAGMLVTTREAYALLDLAGGVKLARTAAPARAAVPLYGESRGAILISIEDKNTVPVG